MFPRFHHHLSYLNNNFNFLKDILPILISSVAVVISVIIPYLLLRYEKAFARNREHKEFLRKMDLFVLEWLNITAQNEDMIDEFLEVLKTPQAIFAKDFQFYEFPPLEFFNTYNIELLNICYVEVRQLKGLDHHLKMISSEYLFYRRMLIETGTDRINNTKDFYTETLKNVKAEYLRVFKDLDELRIIIRILLKKANQVNSITMDKFFTFSQEKMLWHQKDTKFTKEEIEEEKVAMEKEKEVYGKKKSPLG